MSSNIESAINEVSYKLILEIKEKNEQKTKYINEIDKSLGILANDGVYAYYVYVKSKKVEDIFLKKLEPITKYICNTEQPLDNSFFEKLSSDINNLLFFREILEKVLIYARYHAKALDVN
jgi:CRISPR/Cas system CMR-associated protein Cmr5 small subunit